MSRLWNKRIAKLAPYIPGEQPQYDVIKLNTNESPYPPSPLALKAIKESVSDKLRLYPDPCARELRQSIADNFHLSIHQVFVANGSDDVLSHAFRALIKDSSPLLFADVSYGFYPVYSEVFNQPVKHIPVKEDLSIDINDYIQPCGGIIIANPNANTGLSLTFSEIENLLQQKQDCTVIIDEAYVDFGGETVMPLIHKYDNLLVVRTFSKSAALAGLRVGYACGSPELIEGLMRSKDSINPYPLSPLAIAGASTAIKDQEWFSKTIKKIIDNRENLKHDLINLGFKVIPSKANFLLTQHPKYAAKDIFEALKKENIFVRHIEKNPRINQWIRISIGTEEQCRILIEVLSKIIH